MGRLIRLFLGIFLVIMFGGCGPGERISLVFLHSLAPDSSRIDYQALARYTTAFSRARDNVSIKLEYQPFGDIEKISRNPEAFNPAEYPDLLLLPHDHIGKLAEAGSIQPITGFMDRHKAAFFPNALKAVRYQGKAYGVPVHGEALVLVYNKKLVDKAPATIDDLVRYRAKNEPGKVEHTLMFTHYIPYFALPWILGYGGRIFDDQGRPRVNEPATVQAFELYSRLVQQRLAIPLVKNPAYYRKSFIEGKSAFFVTGPWMFAKLRENGIDFGVTPLPRLETGKAVVPFVGYKTIVVFKQKNPRRLKAILNFLQHLITSDFVVKYCTPSRKVPALRAAFADPAIRDDAIIQVFRRQIEQGMPMSNSPRLNLIWTYLNEDRFANIMQAENKKQLLDQVQTLIDKAMEKEKTGTGK